MNWSSTGPRLCGDPAATVEHERLREADDREALLRHALAVAQHRIGELVLVDEGAGVVGHVLHVHTEHGAVLLSHALVPALEQQRLLAAGLTPGGPEVEHHHLPLVVVERLGAHARQPRQLEQRRRVALTRPERPLHVPIGLVLGQPVGEQHEQRAEHQQNGERDRRAAGDGLPNDRRG